MNVINTILDYTIKFLNAALTVEKIFYILEYKKKFEFSVKKISEAYLCIHGNKNSFRRYTWETFKLSRKEKHSGTFERGDKTL